MPNNDNVMMIPVEYYNSQYHSHYNRIQHVVMCIYFTRRLTAGLSLIK